MTDAIFFRLGGELILVFHVKNASRLDPMPPPASPACLLVAIQEVFGPAHLPSRQATPQLLSSQMYLPRAFAKCAQDFFPNCSVPLTSMV
jgi:hypothetical protein